MQRDRDRHRGRGRNRSPEEQRGFTNPRSSIRELPNRPLGRPVIVRREPIGGTISASPQPTSPRPLRLPGESTISRTGFPGDQASLPVPPPTPDRTPRRPCSIPGIPAAPMERAGPSQSKTGFSPPGPPHNPLAPRPTSPADIIPHLGPPRPPHPSSNLSARQELTAHLPHPIHH